VPICAVLPDVGAARPSRLAGRAGHPDAGPVLAGPARPRGVDPAAALFRVDDRVYTWADVVLAGMAWGDWDALEERARQGLACLARVAAGQGDLDPDRVGAAADEFRYERDLLTVEETEDWLARSGLTTEAWLECVRRAVLRGQWADDLVEITTDYPVPTADVRDAIWAEGACAGDWTRLALKLAGRAAVAGPAPDGDERGDPGAAPPMPVVSWLPLAPEDHERRRAHLATLERAFARFRGSAVTPRALREVLHARRLDWIRIRARAVDFGDESAAREAALCVREDREPLRAVAERSRRPIREVTGFLGDLLPAARDRLLGARPGELLGPLPLDGRPGVIQVLEKVLPCSDDPEVRSRAEGEVLRRAVERATTERVRWLRRP
jgi:hypothetical protein